MLQVELWARAGNEDVIEIHEDGPLQATENSIHQPLERLRGVLEPEGHPQKLKQTKWRYNSRLGNILVCHWYLMVTADEIDDGEQLGSGGGGGERLDVRKRIMIIFR